MPAQCRVAASDGVGSLLVLLRTSRNRTAHAGVKPGATGKAEQRRGD